LGNILPSSQRERCGESGEREAFGKTNNQLRALRKTIHCIEGETGTDRDSLHSFYWTYITFLGHVCGRKLRGSRKCYCVLWFPCSFLA